MKTFLITISCIAAVLLGWASFAIGFNIPVPFTSQAPHADWRQPWQDACEETAIAMVDFFYTNKEFTPDIAVEEIEKVLHLKERIFGATLDENATTMAHVINLYMPWEATIVENPTLEQIKNELQSGRPIIVPVYGKALHNPHFRYGGPYYHVLVISGYDDETQEFITQEPGTRYGENFKYSYETLLNANHDFLPNNQTAQGKKVMLFTNQTLTNSGHIDADEDGLTKIEEIQFGTMPWQQDSDGDGFTDGEEVRNGYSPTTVNTKRIEVVLRENMLIKVYGAPEVYLIKNNKKHHIQNETVFVRHGWLWSEIHEISQYQLNNIELGTPITQ